MAVLHNFSNLLSLQFSDNLKGMPEKEEMALLIKAERGFLLFNFVPVREGDLIDIFVAILYLVVICLHLRVWCDHMTLVV